MTRYIGKQPAFGNFVKLDAISVVNGQAAYTMQSGSSNFTNYDNVNQFIVSLNGVIQAPTDSFTVSGSTITFASALSTGDVINFILVLGDVLSIGTPSDNTISTAKIQNTAVNSDKLATDAVQTAKIQNDAVTTDKINLISTSSTPSLEAKGTSGQTDGYIQLNCEQNSHGIKLKSPPHSAGQSYTLTFPSTAPATDKFLKTDSSGNLSFADAGGANTPAFFAFQDGSSAQTISHNTNTKIQFQTEVFDSDNAYDNSSNYRFTPQTAGKYFIFASVMLGTSSDINQVECKIYKNGSVYTNGIGVNLHYNNVDVSTIVDMNGSSDYVEAYIMHNEGSNQNTYPSDTNRYVRFGGYRLIT